MRVPTYEEIISKENLFFAWKEFLKGKKKKRDVQIFQYNLLDNIDNLHRYLQGKTYVHGGYESFNISDPKPRNIHKAIVRDRLLHHAIYRILYPYFEIKFIYDSYSCRKGKGTQKATERFRIFGRRVSKNNTKQCWILKCDVRKFFASIDHVRLIEILKSHRLDSNTIWLLTNVIESFETNLGRGLPLGNLTSQLLVNIYMNEFDQYTKHRLKQKYYIRYADDFVIMGRDKTELEEILTQIKHFLKENLQLDLHPNKVSISTLASGVDFLGWVHFPVHRVLRTTTKRRMLKNLKINPKRETIQSYIGLLGHGNTKKLEERVKTITSVAT